MRDVANAAVGRAVLPEEKVVMHTRPSGINVYYSAEGLADSETGHTECQDGPAFIGRTGVIDALKEGPDNLWFSPATVVYQPDPGSGVRLGTGGARLGPGGNHFTAG